MSRSTDRWPWWGSMHDLMDPTKAAGKFYDALVEVPSWITLPVTVTAQRVQRSAFPSAYADDEPIARQLLNGASVSPSVTHAAVTGEVTASCDEVAAPGTVVIPLPEESGYTDQGNWGNRAAVRAHGHAGTDLSVACGTSVLAATDGTVTIRTDQRWAGRWLGQVVRRPAS